MRRPVQPVGLPAEVSVGGCLLWLTTTMDPEAAAAVVLVWPVAMMVIVGSCSWGAGRGVRRWQGR